ncbi:MAG: hypothetical protein A2750_03460 [Candidatus Yanofskybacteria bacterium RIFCSPHIGHO2_01_FULL_45_42]|uniref:VIT family protein n=3 Tax=Candidatus Yanofskyibacteriota TaxID=1752733 RepID=A0A1F8F090_9BACT|nr:MAG: hypothetical protein A2750_03460 [Candidatus Yanofskybacteria bacterium RIFCSPHIGHO2_01_FULL_45_42]OGN16128.1 MAG: hypothetical protein A3C81_00950 [Candidatus Yanofskybacteria bacterium RIFCSPHIGHO2_02_FULL_46_19]OGN26252.1 MAG: hypothetical protein A3B17_02710 [Candidatus Yanofskybacteria bacterium RIFCSPLOWO2_01_FULL_45_72]OGN31782.1 MAG: hypothetical protein A3J01_03265 [Candidatus Yanofskybacteria bacterium RIFCSPLOWO2_02_FULL_45_18]
MDGKQVYASYLRSFTFGVEDSLVSTVGFLSGIAAAGINSQIIILSGLVLIFVESFSMAVGIFLSEYSAENYLSVSKSNLRTSFNSGTIMFFSYFISGFIPLAPYILFAGDSSLAFSLLFSLMALFALGVVGARISGASVWKNGFRTLIIGGFAVVVGVVVGRYAAKFNL